VLGDRGYEYDCSTLPTYIAPLARAFYMLRAPDVSPEEREKLKKLFGKFSDGFRSLRPHYVDAGGKQIVEIPVTTFPVVKTPIHASYLMYLMTFSPALARLYWRMSVTACKLTGVQPSLLLHPLDFLSGDDVSEMRFFPAMNLPATRKIEFLDFALGLLADDFDIVTMRGHADSFRGMSFQANNGVQAERA